MTAAEIERLAAEVVGRYVSPCRLAADHSWWCDTHEHPLRHPDSLPHRAPDMCDVAGDALNLAEDAIRATLDRVTPPPPRRPE